MKININYDFQDKNGCIDGWMASNSPQNGIHSSISKLHAVSSFTIIVLPLLGWEVMIRTLDQRNTLIRPCHDIIFR